MPTTLNLGPCECCGGNGSTVRCPSVCNAVATVESYTATPDAPISTTVGNVSYYLSFARSQAGTGFVSSSAIDVRSRASLEADNQLSGYYQNFSGAPSCQTISLVVGSANVQRLQSDQNVEHLYDSTHAKLGSVGSGGRDSEHFIIFSKINSTAGFPAYSAVWAWDWSDADGIITDEYTITGVNESGTLATVFPALTLDMDFVMPLGCNSDGSCTTLESGDLWSGATAFACDCCGEPESAEGCGPCDNPLP